MEAEEAESFFSDEIAAVAAWGAAVAAAVEFFAHADDLGFEPDAEGCGHGDGAEGGHVPAEKALVSSGGDAKEGHPGPGFDEDAGHGIPLVEDLGGGHGLGDLVESRDGEFGGAEAEGEACDGDGVLFSGAEVGGFDLEPDEEAACEVAVDVGAPGG